MPTPGSFSMPRHLPTMEVSLALPQTGGHSFFLLTFPVPTLSSALSTAHPRPACPSSARSVVFVGASERGGRRCPLSGLSTWLRP